MLEVFKKEIRGFFSSLTGYVVIVIFLLITSLFIWVFPGQINVLEGGYASLDGLFSIAPWVFLFLVPAITMRMIAEEKRMGTLELLLSRPISELQIVMGKFLASWCLVLLSLLPTLVFYFTIYRLGSPVGNIDSAGTWGAYIGLLFLGGIYAAIGIFASALTDNQIVAFILAVLLSVTMYLGFDVIAGLAGTGQLQFLITRFGIDYHYQSVSRGVLDTRDILYFTGAVTLFILSSRIVLQKTRW